MRGFRGVSWVEGTLAAVGFHNGMNWVAFLVEIKLSYTGGGLLVKKSLAGSI